ncbi:hypothetical protein D3C71_919620 [compost metagenome]
MTIGKACPTQQLGERRFGRELAGDRRGLTSGDEGAGIEDLQAALLGEDRQTPLQRPRAYAERTHGVDRLRRHRRRDTHHQRGERG